MAASDKPCAGTHCSHHHHHDGHHHGHGHGHSDHRHGEEKAVESLRKLKVKVDSPPTSTLPSPTVPSPTKHHRRGGDSSATACAAKRVRRQNTYTQHDHMKARLKMLEKEVAATNTLGVVLQTQGPDLLNTVNLTMCKGCYWARAQHALHDEMMKWTQEQPEPTNNFAEERVPVTFGKHSSVEDKKKETCGWETGCCRLCQRLPKSFRDAVSTDAKMLCELLVASVEHARENCKRARQWTKNPDSKTTKAMKNLERGHEGVEEKGEEEKRCSCDLCMQIEIVGWNACSRWHQDAYLGRSLVTYCGPGTWLADDENVHFDQFQPTLGSSVDESDARIVPRFDHVHTTPTNSIVFMKGNRWPGIRGLGVTHKSPNVPMNEETGDPMLKRLILKVDIKNNHVETD